MARKRVRYWARTIPWHNWIFAGYYAFFGFAGANVLAFPPNNISQAAGPTITIAWGVSSIVCAVIGLFGALRPNFRSEIIACWMGIFAIVCYASTTQVIILSTGDFGRAGPFWVTISHVWIFVLRLVFIRINEKRKAEQLIAELKADA